MIIYSPMEQFLINPVININLTINNIVLFLILASFLTIQFSYVGGRVIASSSWGILSETLFRTLLALIESFLGAKYTNKLPLFYTIFHMILFSNLIGLIPYSSSPSVEKVITLSIATTLIGGILLFGFLTHKLYLFALFIPGGTPLALIPLMVILEIIAYMSRTLSMGLRLSINIIVGHVLAKTIINFVWLAYLKGTSLPLLIIPLFLLTLFFCLEILICILQSYILVFIAILTVKDIA